VLRYEHNKLLV